LRKFHRKRIGQGIIHWWQTGFEDRAFQR